MRQPQYNVLFRINRMNRSKLIQRLNRVDLLCGKPRQWIKDSISSNLYFATIQLPTTSGALRAELNSGKSHSLH